MRKRLPVILAGLIISPLAALTSSAHADATGPTSTPVLGHLYKFDNSGEGNAFTGCAAGETKVFTLTMKIKQGAPDTIRFARLRESKAVLYTKDGTMLSARARTVNDSKREVTFNLFDTSLDPGVRPDKMADNGFVVFLKNDYMAEYMSVSRISKFCVTFNAV